MINQAEKKPSSARPWLIAADRGGTFTDIIGIDPDGRVQSLKLLSESAAYEDALIEGIHRLLAIPSQAAIDPALLAEVRIGTTVATNALLERKGAPTALVTSAGFADLLEIGYQNRPRLFDLAIKKPSQLYDTVVEVTERLDASGAVLQTLDESAVRFALRRIKTSGINSIAVVLMHAWINPAHEQAIGRIAAEIGFEQISLSHQCMRVIKIVGRGQTTMVDAYLSPILHRYVRHIQGQLGSTRVQFMQSSGGLADAGNFTGKDAVLSGPAGGVVAVASLAQQLKRAQVVGFDMGGTSTDVCRFGGEYEHVFETETAGICFQSNMLQVETVAAGGGSILGFDGQRLTVGPESAGANPGPTCYGFDGPLTVTDANLLLGRLVPEAFPHQFGPNQDDAINPDATRAKFDELATRINAATSNQLSPNDVALGYLRIANEQMAKPVKTLSISKGYDVREHSLCSFGGAGGLHACAIAKTLGMTEIIIHPLAGLFSAYGIAVADQVLQAEQSVLQPLNIETLSSLPPIIRALSQPLLANVAANSSVTPEITEQLDLRVMGSDGVIRIKNQALKALQTAFCDAHVHRFGYAADQDELEIVAVHVAVTVPSRHNFTQSRSMATVGKASLEHRIVTFDSGPQSVPCYEQRCLTEHSEIQSPALIVDDFSTVLIEPGFTARIDHSGCLMIERDRDAVTVAQHAETGRVANPATPHDPILLEVFNNLFMSVAEQMGATLVKTAHSVNMRERYDFSCAIFDSAGRLIANAPHIPVHLGAMGATVQSLLKHHSERLQPGRVFATNHPARGGSHLPDVTVISPIYLSDAADTADFFVATRGHHADIGGVTPGSMSPFSKTLVEEGVILDGFLLVDQGQFLMQAVRDKLSSGEFPARNIDERLSDLSAQIAANRTGERELLQLVAQHGATSVRAYMGHIRDNAAHSIRLALGRWLKDQPSFEASFDDQLDEGCPICVKLVIRAGDHPPDSHTIEIDFNGTGAQLSNSLNAPEAVVKAAVMYVLRALVHDDIPLNDGCFEPVKLSIPKGSVLSPDANAAVVGGNVETSQRVVDVLLGALGVAAASQGTMNNLALGWQNDDGEQQYYETIAGGSGAVEGFDGADAVQVHMTNTRITDPEELEYRYPGLRLRAFKIRQDSGGEGRWRGGHGVVRDVEILQACSVSLLTQRRRTQAFGLAHGENGLAGRNTLIRDNREIELANTVDMSLRRGDILRIETPGGGGFGAAVEGET